MFCNVDIREDAKNHKTLSSDVVFARSLKSLLKRTAASESCPFQRKFPVALSLRFWTKRGRLQTLPGSFASWQKLQDAFPFVHCPFAFHKGFSLLLANTDKFPFFFELSPVLLFQFFHSGPQNFKLWSSDPCIFTPWSSNSGSSVENCVAQSLVRKMTIRFWIDQTHVWCILHNFSKISSEGTCWIDNKTSCIWYQNLDRRHHMVTPNRSENTFTYSQFVQTFQDVVSRDLGHRQKNFIPSLIEFLNIIVAKTDWE